MSLGLWRRVRWHVAKGEKNRCEDLSTQLTAPADFTLSYPSYRGREVLGSAAMLELGECSGG